MNSLTDILNWWMSLNNTEKKSLEYIETLVISVERTINEEFRKWSSDSVKQFNKNDSENDELIEVKEENNK